MSHGQLPALGANLLNGAVHNMAIDKKGQLHKNMGTVIVLVHCTLHYKSSPRSGLKVCGHKIAVHK